MNEIWKQIDGFSNYYVSNMGNIKRAFKTKEKYLSPYSKDDYLQVKLCNSPIIKCRYVHDLVFEAFYRKLQPNEIVHHLSEVKTENISTNLVAKDIRFHSHEHNKGKQHFLGHHHTEQTKKKMSLSALKRNANNGDEENK